MRRKVGRKVYGLDERICHSMIALIQRVLTASVRVEGRLIGAIETGMLALIGIVRAR